MRDKEIEIWKESLALLTDHYGSVGNRVDVTVRAFATHQCGPMSEDFLREFFLGSPGFLPPQLDVGTVDKEYIRGVCHCKFLFIFF